MDVVTLASLMVPPFVGGTAWLWHLGVKVATLDTRLDDIALRLARIEHLLDSLVRLNGR